MDSREDNHKIRNTIQFRKENRGRSIIKQVFPTEDPCVHVAHAEMDKAFPSDFLSDFENPECQINDLFFDLIFVAGVSTLNDMLIKEELQAIEWFTWFFINWVLWRSFTLYESVFGQDDIIHKLYGGIYGLSLVLLIVELKHKRFGNACFQVAFNYFLQALMIYRARSHISDLSERDLLIKHRFPTILKYTYGWTQGCIFAICVWTFVGLLLPYDWAILCAILIVPIYDARNCIRFPFEASLHPPFKYIKERFEGYTLIVLGECIVDIVNATDGEPPSKIFYYNISFSVLIIIFVKFFIFDCDAFDNTTHAFSISNTRRVASQYCVCFKGMGVALLGASIAMLMKADFAPTRSEFDRGSTCIGLAMALLLLCHWIDCLLHYQTLEMFPHAIELWRAERICEFTCMIIFAFFSLIFQHESPAWKPLGLTFFIILLDDCIDYIPHLVHDLETVECEEKTFCSSDLIFEWNPTPIVDHELNRKSESDERRHVAFNEHEFEEI